MLRDRQRMTASVHRTFQSSVDPLGLEQRRLFAEQMAIARQNGIDRWYREGGHWFLKWVEDHYRRWTGEPLKWDEPYQRPAYLLRGNPWLERIIEEKGGQIGFSESMIALCAFILAEIRISCAYGFEQEGKKRDMVAPRIQPAFDNIEPLLKLSRAYRQYQKREDTDSKDRKITIAGVPLTFFHAKTNATTKSQERQAPPSMTSFEAWFIVIDEVEACPAGTVDIARERQSASTLHTKPIRTGSTPGAEGGIVDAQVKQAKWLFQWQVRCPHCQTLQFVHPFGSLLKPMNIMQDDGSFEEQFIDITGRPMDWFSHSTDKPYTQLESLEDRDQKIRTAYIGCIECGQELTWESRAEGRFAHNPNPQSRTCICPTETLQLEAFHDQVIEARQPVDDWVALRLPRLASLKFRAPERIRNLVFSKNPADTIQQGLGVAVSVGMGKISYARLLKCVATALPAWCRDRDPDLRVRGIDQSPGGHWFVDQEWYFPPDEKDKEQRYYNAHVRIVNYGRMGGFDDLDQAIRVQQLDLIGCDMEPEQTLAAKEARLRSPRRTRKGKFYAFDQMSLRGEPWKEAIRVIQKQKVRIYTLDRTWGLDQVRDRVNKSLLHLPANLVYDPKDPENLLYHFLTSERQQGKWTEPDGEPDHLFHAANFGEAAVHVSLFGRKGGSLMSGLSASAAESPESSDESLG